MGKFVATVGKLLLVVLGICAVYRKPLSCFAQDKADESTGTAQASWKEIAIGNAKLDIGGSLRFRFEYQNNFNIKKYGQDTIDGFLLERLRLNFKLAKSKDLFAFVQLQDAHVWDSDFDEDDFAKGAPYENPLDLRQAFIEWQHIGGSQFGLKLGRQAIFYGDNRIWGPANWGNVGRYAWDAAKLLYDGEAVSLDAIFAQRVRYDPHEFDDSHFDYDVYGIYASVKNLPFTTDLFYVHKLDDHGTTLGEMGMGDLKSHTVGTHVAGKFWGNFDHGGTLAYQFGNWGKDDIEALGLNARVGYSFDRRWSPRIGAEYTYASGDSNPTDGDHETFDGVFGSPAKYYGRMNLFYWMNLQDYMLTLSLKPSRKLKASLDWHLFQLAEAKDAWYYCNGKPQRKDPTGSSGRDLGQELDLILQYALSQDCQLMGGYGLFRPGDFVEDTGASGNAHWAFLQMMYSF